MKLASLTPLAIGLVLLGTGAASANVCINVPDIVNTRPDHAGKSITFTMRDGTVWRNDLQTPCPDLRYDGFAWTLEGTREVCDRQQSIRVFQSGEICMLGNFTKVTSAKAKRAQ